MKPRRGRKPKPHIVKSYRIAKDLSRRMKNTAKLGDMTETELVERSLDKTCLHEKA